MMHKTVAFLNVLLKFSFFTLKMDDSLRYRTFKTKNIPKLDVKAG
jgi:hypothetical protein